MCYVSRNHRVLQGAVHALASLLHCQYDKEDWEGEDPLTQVRGGLSRATCFAVIVECLVGHCSVIGAIVSHNAPYNAIPPTTPSKIAMSHPL